MKIKSSPKIDPPAVVHPFSAAKEEHNAWLDLSRALAVSLPDGGGAHKWTCNCGLPSCRLFSLIREWGDKKAQAMLAAREQVDRSNSVELITAIERMLPLLLDTRDEAVFARRVLRDAKAR